MSAAGQGHAASTTSTADAVQMSAADQGHLASTTPTADAVQTSPAGQGQMATPDYFCLYCSEKYVEPIREDWIMCAHCLQWCHQSCAGRKGRKRGKFVCDSCS